MINPTERFSLANVGVDPTWSTIQYAIMHKIDNYIILIYNYKKVSQIKTYICGIYISAVNSIQLWIWTSSGEKFANPTWPIVFAKYEHQIQIDIQLFIYLILQKREKKKKKKPLIWKGMQAMWIKTVHSFQRKKEGQHKKQ